MILSLSFSDSTTIYIDMFFRILYFILLNLNKFSNNALVQIIACVPHIVKS